MAIVTFFNDYEKETGQTMASIAVATTMAIDHNYKILEIATGYKEKTIQNCFFDQKIAENIASIVGGTNSGINTGIEGLVKIMQSNKTSSNIISDYAKVVFKDRFDIIAAPETDIRKEYDEIATYYPQLAKIASKSYNLIFIDIDKKMREEDKKKILDVSDVIVVVVKQGADTIKYINGLRQKDERYKKKNIILLIGKYDKYSKYNTKNITREIRDRNEICAISYNTLFFEASGEGKVPDFFFKYRSIADKSDRNLVFMQEAKRTCDTILAKLKELQIKL